MAEKQVMVVGIDDSEHSFYALEWIIEHFFNPPSSSAFKLVVVHAKSVPSSVIGLAGPGSGDVIPIVEADLKKAAQRVAEKAKELCQSKSVTTSSTGAAIPLLTSNISNRNVKFYSTDW